YFIISILAHRNPSQCNLIHKTYAETYGEDLLKSLEKELSSNFERAILLWTMDHTERDTFLANEATKRGFKQSGFNGNSLNKVFT
ncbi:hypothetical protein GIB67_040425, partial [Kingdonia uniflora]